MVTRTFPPRGDQAGPLLRGFKVSAERIYRCLIKKGRGISPAFFQNISPFVGITKKTECNRETPKIPGIPYYPIKIPKCPKYARRLIASLFFNGIPPL
jgi:hypothetical protein